MRDRLAAETTEEKETRLQQMSTYQRERLAVETTKERELRLECYRTRYMEQQSVQPQLSLFQHRSIQANMPKISCKHGNIGYTDMLHLL